MRFGTSAFVAVVIIFFLVPFPVADATAASGPQGDPYVIDSISDLKSIGSELPSDGRYILGSDLVFGAEDAITAGTISVTIVSNTFTVVTDSVDADVTMYLNGTTMTKQSQFVFTPPTRFSDASIVTVVGTDGDGAIGFSATVGVIKDGAVFPSKGNMSPIGGAAGFSGSFDGRGHSITGMKVMSSDGSAGMFSKLSAGASVMDLSLTKGEASYVISVAVGTDGRTDSIAGALAPTAEGAAVDGCSSELFVMSCVKDNYAVPDGVTMLDVCRDSLCGGLVGSATDCSFTDDTLSGSVFSSIEFSTHADVAVSGISSFVFDSAAYGDRSGDGARTVAGGLVGCDDGSCFHRCTSSGAATGSIIAATDISIDLDGVTDVDVRIEPTMTAHIGGLVGIADGSEVALCRSSEVVSHIERLESDLSLDIGYGNDARVGCAKDISLGGFVGTAKSSSFRDCEFRGTVFGVVPADSQKVSSGGIAGSADGATSYGDCLSAGTVNDSSFCGAITGSQSVFATGSSSGCVHIGDSDAFGTGIASDTFVGMVTAVPEGWDAERVWIFDGHLQLDPRYHVTFVDAAGSVHDYSVSFAGVASGTNGPFRDDTAFSLLLGRSVDRSVPSVSVNGIVTATVDGAYPVSERYDVSGVPEDITITISGLTKNRYHVSPPLFSGVSVECAGYVTHGDPLHVSTASTDYDVSAMGLDVTGCDAVVVASGTGSFVVYGIDDDVSLSFSDVESLPDGPTAATIALVFSVAVGIVTIVLIARVLR